MCIIIIIYFLQQDIMLVYIMHRTGSKFHFGRMMINNK